MRTKIVNPSGTLLLNPATEDKQDDLLVIQNASLAVKSTVGGTQKLTIASNVVVGTNQACRSCLIHCPTGNTGAIHLTLADEAADVNDFLIPEGIVIPIPISNLSVLHFYGATNDDLIYVLWRN